MHWDLTLQDYFAVFSLLFALVLTVIGSVAGTRFLHASDRIDRLEKRLDREREELLGLRIVASTIFDFVSDSYALADIERRMIYDVIMCVKQSCPAAAKHLDGKVFLNNVKAHFEEMPRVTLFLDLLSPDNQKFPEVLKDLCDRYPDGKTVRFLEAIEKVFGDRGGVLNEYVSKLGRKVYPFQFKYWM